MVRWLIGFTEIASVQLPDNLMYSKLVPYIELNEVGDIILLNGWLLKQWFLKYVNFKANISINYSLTVVNLYKFNLTAEKFAI